MRGSTLLVLSFCFSKDKTSSFDDNGVTVLCKSRSKVVFGCFLPNRFQRWNDVHSPAVLSAHARPQITAEHPAFHSVLFLSTLYLSGTITIK